MREKEKKSEGGKGKEDGRGKRMEGRDRRRDGGRHGQMGLRRAEQEEWKEGAGREEGRKRERERG